MELTQEHRKALVVSLIAAIEKREQLIDFIVIEQDKVKQSVKNELRDSFIIKSIEVDQFLNNQQIMVIESALIDNEIDL